MTYFSSSSAGRELRLQHQDRGLNFQGTHSDKKYSLNQMSNYNYECLIIYD